MKTLSEFEITKRWPAENPNLLQLYSMGTPNGLKVSIALEEAGLDYEAHFVDFASADQMTPEFLSLNPNNKIPAIIDPNGPGNAPLPLFESGAILIYLAEKTGKLMPEDPAKRYEALQWLMFQMGGVGPMFGQFGFFHKFAGSEISDPRPKQRYQNETIRLLGVLDDHLEGRDWMMDDFSIVDIALGPWINVLTKFYDAYDVLEMEDVPNVMHFLKRFLDRPAVQRGLLQPKRPET